MKYYEFDIELVNKSIFNDLLINRLKYNEEYLCSEGDGVTLVKKADRNDRDTGSTEDTTATASMAFVVTG